MKVSKRYNDLLDMYHYKTGKSFFEYEEEWVERIVKTSGGRNGCREELINQKEYLSLR